MPKPYSYDFRQKVIQAIELDGLKKHEASELFNISRNTINLWLKRKAETGDVQALPNNPPGNNHKQDLRNCHMRSPPNLSQGHGKSRMFELLNQVI